MVCSRGPWIPCRGGPGLTTSKHFFDTERKFHDELDYDYLSVSAQIFRIWDSDRAYYESSLPTHLGGGVIKHFRKREPVNGKLERGEGWGEGICAPKDVFAMFSYEIFPKFAMKGGG